MFLLDMVFKSICFSFKVKALQATNETVVVHVFHNLEFIISQFRESIHNDTKGNIQGNGADDDKEGEVQQEFGSITFPTWYINKSISTHTCSQSFLLFIIYHYYYHHYYYCLGNIEFLTLNFNFFKSSNKKQTNKQTKTLIQNSDKAFTQVITEEVIVLVKSGLHESKHGN